MADPTILLRKNILSRLDRESERRQLALKTDMSVPLPKLEDLAIPDIYRLDAYVAKHNTELALIKPDSWKSQVFRLSKEWHAQHQSMLSSTTAGCGATYDLHRPHSRDIPGLKFFDQVRQEFISVATLDTFRERFEHFTKGILKGLDFYKCVVAGGCVQACLVSFPGSGPNAAYEDSDIDIFIVGATRFQASAKLLHVEAVLRKNVEDFDNVYKIVRTPATVTFTAIHGAHRHHYRQVQVILVLYPDVVDVISHFDLDHTALAYNGEEVFISARAARAIWIGYSTLTDAIRGSTAPRILKYAHRGFGLLLPNDDDMTIRTIVEREKTHVKNLHEEMTRQNLQDRMGPLLSLSKTGLPHQWTHALTSLSRLEGLWEIACGNTKREKKLFTAAKGHGGMYGFYNETNPDSWHSDVATYVESFVTMNFVLEDVLQESFAEQQQFGGVPFIVGNSVSEVSGKNLCVSVVLPCGLREALSTSRIISLRYTQFTNVVEDNTGNDFELCKWTLTPARMWSPPPSQAMAPHIRFLKKATMLTSWAVRRVENGAPWDEIRHAKTLQQMVHNDIDAATSRTENFKAWLRA